MGGETGLLVVQQVLDLALQALAVLGEDVHDGALLIVERPGHALAQQLGALADGGERRLEIVGYMAQETTLLLFQLRQALAQPIQPASQVGQVLGARHRNSISILGAADGADGAVHLLDLARDHVTEPQGDHQRHGDGGQQLPQQQVVGALGHGLQALHLRLDHGAPGADDPARLVAHGHQFRHLVALGGQLGRARCAQARQQPVGARRHPLQRQPLLAV